MIQFSTDITPKVPHNKLLDEDQIDLIKRWGKTAKGKRVSAKKLAESLGCSPKTIFTYAKNGRKFRVRKLHEVKCYICGELQMRVTSKSVVLCKKPACRNNYRKIAIIYSRRYRILRDLLGFEDAKFESFVQQLRFTKIRRLNDKKLQQRLADVELRKKEELVERAQERKNYEGF